jgi:hypothetical protein
MPFLRNPNLCPFNLLFPSHWMWKLHLWFFTDFSITLENDGYMCGTSRLYRGLYVLRTILHLEVEPLHCVRGLKSPLVIGQKVEINPNPFIPKGWAVLVVSKIQGLTWSELVELGAPKMEGQFLASGPMSHLGEFTRENRRTTCDKKHGPIYSL